MHVKIDLGKCARAAVGVKRAVQGLFPKWISVFAQSRARDFNHYKTSPISCLSADFPFLLRSSTMNLTQWYAVSIAAIAASLLARYAGFVISALLVARFQTTATTKERSGVNFAMGIRPAVQSGPKTDS